VPDSPILFLVLGGLVLGFTAWAGWAMGARRARRLKPLPDSVWLCPACRSINEPDRDACYHCRAPRPSDARTIVPEVEFHVDQRFGREIDDGGRGGTGAWLGAEEPLLDAWLARRSTAATLEPTADDAPHRRDPPPSDG